MATTTISTPNMIRSEIWSKQIQEELQEELFGQTLVTWVESDFPDGNTLTIPKLGHLSAADYNENADIAVQDPTVNEFQLTIDTYRQAGIAVTDKMKEDTFYIEFINTKFPQQMTRAIMERLENDIMLLHKKQTTNDANTINGVAHRYVGTGTSVAMALKDIAQAKLALDKANVSRNGRVAIVDPWVSYQLLQIDNVIRQDVYGANTSIKEGFGGTKFIGRYMGFDFYESNMLDEATALDHAAGGAYKANLFMGEEAFIGAIRSMPTIEQSRDWQKKRDVYHCTIRYGLDLFRKESLVTVLTAAV